MSELVAFFASSQIKWIVTLIAVDFVLGIVVSIMKKTFRLGKVAKFMGIPVLGYVWGFVILEMVAIAIPSLVMIVKAAYFLIILALVGSILHSISKLGISLPAYLKKE